MRPVKNQGNSGGGHWLVRMEWRPAGWFACLPLLIFPCTIKSRSSLLAPAHPGGPGKRAVKLLCVCVCVFHGDCLEWQDGQLRVIVERVHHFVLFSDAVLPMSCCSSWS